MTPTKDISRSSTNSPFMRYAVLATLVLTVFVITSFVFNVKNLDSKTLQTNQFSSGRPKPIAVFGFWIIH